MTEPEIRDARDTDLPAIIALLAQDAMGGEDDDPSEPLDSAYCAAFDAMKNNPDCRLLVAELDGRVVGTFQIDFLAGLLFHGAWRGQIEAVRVADDMRGRGLGETMMRAAIAMCRARRCRIVQLTSNVARTRAHGFYERLGFVKSHVGMKLMLGEGDA